jgi:hypothetical protein
MKKFKIILSSFVGFISATLGVIGVTGFCCTITGAALLSFFGIASISSFLIYNNKWFFLIAIVFVVLAIVYYIKYKRNKSCKIKNV